MNIITERHMDFLKEAIIRFKDNDSLATFRNSDGILIAWIHSVKGRQTKEITITEFGETVAKFEFDFRNIKEEENIQTNRIIRKWREDYGLMSSVSRYDNFRLRVELQMYVPPSIAGLFR